MSPSASAEAAVRAAMTALLRLGAVEAESRFTPLEGGKLHHLEAGRGTPLVLVHGAGGGGANWYRVMGPLSRSFRVLAPELPGFGLSDAIRPRGDLGVHSAEVLLDWLSHVVDEPCDVAGTSFGGLVTLRMAQHAPRTVRRIVLVDSVGLGRQLPVAVRGAAMRGLGRLLLAPSRAGTQWLFRTLLVGDPSSLPDAHRSALVEYLYACARGSAATLRAALPGFASLHGQKEVLSDAELRALGQPALLLWGERDRFLPLTHAERAARLIPRASLHVIGGSGHSPNWERPMEVTNHMMAFLRP